MRNSLHRLFARGLLLLAVAVGMPVLGRAQPDADPPSADAAIATTLGLEAVDRPSGRGLLVAAVAEEGPATAAGVRDDDILLSINGRALESVAQLGKLLQSVNPGDELAIVLSRNRKERKATLIAGGDRPAAEFDVDEDKVDLGLLGMHLYDAPNKQVVVSNVAPTGPAAIAGVQKGDTLVRFAEHDVSNTKDLADFSSQYIPKLQPGDEVAIVIEREEKRQEMAIIVPEDFNPAEPLPSEGSAADPTFVVFCMLVEESPRQPLLVLKVAEGSPPDAAGILPGDEIVAVDGRDIYTAGELSQAIKLHKIGDTAAFDVLRDDETVGINVIVGCCEVSGVPGEAAPTEDLAATIEALRRQVAELQATVEALAVQAGLRPAVSVE